MSVGVMKDYKRNIDVTVFGTPTESTEYTFEDVAKPKTQFVYY